MRRVRREGSVEEIVARLVALGSPENIDGMRRFGIRPQTQLLGVSVTDIRKIAREYEPNHQLALGLWGSDIHEVRILASMVDIATEVAVEQMNAWAQAFDSWDVCDQVCQNLFRHTDFVVDRAEAWMCSNEEFVKRAAFALVATAASAEALTDDECRAFLPLLVGGMADNRNFVKKAVSWAFRQIGKRSLKLRHEVLDAVAPLADSADPSTKWIARDVVKELNGPKTISRIKH